MSTESIVASPSSVHDATACASCGTPLAADQRYCLECGARRADAPSFFLDTLSAQDVNAAPAAATTPPPPAPAARSSPAAVIAGIGVLLLAMGVGVLIGRAGGTAKTPPAQVISVGSVGSGGGVAGAGASTAGSAAAGSSASAAPTGAGSSSAAPTTGGAAGTGSSVADTWVGASGYTVELQTAAAAGAVTAALASARRQGATGVGVLRASAHPGLPAVGYIIYSGDYTSAAVAARALAGLNSKFPSATVIHVVSATGAAAAAPTPPAAAATPPKSGSGSGGQSYEQKSSHLPDQIGT